MSHSLTWLPEVLRAAGLRVAEVPGWERRGHGDVGETLGVLCHHTAGRKTGNMPSLRVLIDGRHDLRGPLSQLGLGRDGTYYVICAGRANHAGEGIWTGISQGNDHFIGIEAEHSGTREEAWPEKQFLAYAHGVAAILSYLGLDAERCAGHKEYAPKRKADPSFDMHDFRARVRDIMSGAMPGLQPVPAAEPTGQQRPTLFRGVANVHVAELQLRLGIAQSGLFDAFTEARVRAFQRLHGLVPDGIVGPKSWVLVDAQARAA
jgi:peptidoglycan hydrolase-like protein with peptidoglycan-binding domain